MEETDQTVIEMDMTDGYLMLQKIFGVILLIISVVVPLVINGDVTADFIFLPFGIGLLTTKEKVIV